MDRSLIQMKRNRSGMINGRRIGVTARTTTTPPHDGTVALLRHWHNIAMSNAGPWTREIIVPARSAADGRRSARRAAAVTVPMELVCTRRTMPAADVTGNRPQQRPFVNRAPNTPALQGVQ